MPDIFDEITKEDMQNYLVRKGQSKFLQPESITEKIGSALVPESPAGKAAFIASLATPGLAQMALPGRLLLQALARIGIPAITAGLTAKATGTGEFGPEFAKVAGPMGLMETAFPAGRAGLKFVRGIQTRGSIEDTLKNKTTEFVDAIISRVKSFEGLPATQKTLDRLKDRVGAEELIREKTWKVLDRALAGMPEQPVSLGGNIGTATPAPTMIKPADLLDTLQDTKKAVWRLGRQVKEGKASIVELKAKVAEEQQLEAAFKQILVGQPTLKRTYDQAVQDWRRGMQSLDLVEDLSKQGVIQPTRVGTGVDDIMLAEFLSENQRDYPRLFFNKVYKVAEGKGPVGSKAIMESLFKGERVFGRIPGTLPGGAAVTLPPLIRRLEPGVTRASVMGPTPLQLLGEPLGLRGIQEFMGE